MSLNDDFNKEIKKIFNDQWSTRKGQVVPDPSDLQLGNDAIEFERATVLYADLSSSTALVDAKIWWFAAEIYKTFLHCAAKIIRDQGGTITSYDGDRIMAIFLGDSQTTAAALCGLKINYAVQFIINPALHAKYPDAGYVVRQVVGIDTSEIRAARTGVRGDNDIVWVGRASNYAAKLTELDLTPRTWLTEDAYNVLHISSRDYGNPPTNMWEKYTWYAHGNRTIYGSTWWWKV